MAYQFTNEQIAVFLRQMAAVHEVKGEGRFKVAAYQNAADSVEHLNDEVLDLWQEGHLGKIPAVGKSIASYLDELFRTGKVKHFEESKKGIAPGFFVIFGLPGIGPKTAFKISQKFKIKSVEDLKELASRHKLSQLSGFGKKSEEEILKGIDEYQRRSDRLLLPVADRLAQSIVKELKEDLGRKRVEIKAIEPLGSLRRMVATVGDIDIAVSSIEANKVVESFINLPSVSRMLEKGPRKASVVLKSGPRADLMVEPPQTWGSLLQHFTGSKLHNIHLRKVALGKGKSLSEYGIKEEEESPKATLMKYKPSLRSQGSLKQSLKSSLRLNFSDEADFYKALGMSYIPPELREDQGEIEAAQSNSLPHLVALGDIKGDLHPHSNFGIEPSHDLGSASMEEIIQRGEELGYEYLTFSEHSPALSTHSKEEIIRLVQNRNLAIDRLELGSDLKKGSDPQRGSDPKLGLKREVTLLKSMEVDILPDGQLALPEEALKELDLVLIGIHSAHRQSREQMTKRILKALDNPYVNVLTHPTGRLLLQRESYEVDWHKVFEVCVKKHIALEINAYPSRLDLPDTLVHEAKEKGVKFVINTDSHSLLDMDNMKYGVAVAARGWCEKEDVLNTWPLEEMMKWFRRKEYNQ